MDKFIKTLLFLIIIIAVSTNIGVAGFDSTDFHGVPSYSIIIYQKYYEVNKGDIVNFSIHITGVGDVDANKLWISIPPNIVKEKIELKEYKYLCGWNNVSGSDSDRLIRFLRDNYDVDCVENANLSKSNDSKIIIISKDKKNSAEIMYDEKNEKVTMKLSDGRTRDLYKDKGKNSPIFYLDSHELDNFFGTSLSASYFKVVKNPFYSLGELQFVGDEGEAPITFEFTVDDNAPEGDHEIFIILYYKNAKQWYQSQELVKIHVNSWPEQHIYLSSVLITLLAAIVIAVASFIWKFIRKRVKNEEKRN